MEMIITTRGLCKQYGKVMRVKNLNLNVPDGAVYGFLGPNGAGKTTTLKMILGLAKPTAGAITVFGKQVNRHNRLPILRGIGSLVESPSYYGNLTGEENLRIIQTLRDVPESEIMRVLSIVRLDKQKGKKVSQYSLGMKQRLGLAYALLGNPKLLILDEPTNGLDPAGIQEMRELIRSLPQQFGMTVVVSSHLLSEIDQIATHVGIINKGELVFQDNLSVLHKKSQHKIAIRTLNNGAAMRIFQTLKVPFATDDNFLLLPIMEDNSIANLISYLSKNQIGVIRVEERRKNLEDIFLSLTGMAVSL